MWFRRLVALALSLVVAAVVMWAYHPGRDGEVFFVTDLDGTRHHIPIGPPVLIDRGELRIASDGVMRFGGGWETTVSRSAHHLTITSVSSREGSDLQQRRCIVALRELPLILRQEQMWLMTPGRLVLFPSP